MPRERSLKRPYLFLLFSLSLLFFATPFLPTQQQRVGVSLVTSAVLLSSVTAVSRRKWFLWLGLLLVVPAVGAKWVSFLLDSPLLDGLANITTAGFLFLTVAVILGHILKARRVDGETIYGSVCVYLLLGMAWAFVLALLQSATVEAFGTREVATADLVYFSYATLTTLGYGDITPVSAPAKSLAVLEAMTGQLYLAVLVARLVSLHVFFSLNGSGADS